MCKNEKMLKAYLDYERSEEAAIVFIAKNLVKDLDTKNKWVHVVDYDCWGRKGGRNGFNYIVVELFDRKLHPVYPKGADIKLKRAITWDTAHEDIKQQQDKGAKGPKFLITCQLYNRNKGKYELKERPFWNEEYGGFDYTEKEPTTIVFVKKSMEPEWVYRVTGCRKINDTRLQYIKKNYDRIYERILKEKHVELECFF